MRLFVPVDVPAPTQEDVLLYMFGAGFYHKGGRGWHEWYGKPEQKDYIGGIMRYNRDVDTPARYARYFEYALAALIERVAKYKSLEPIQVWEGMINAGRPSL